VPTPAPRDPVSNLEDSERAFQLYFSALSDIVAAIRNFSLLFHFSSTQRAESKMSTNALIVFVEKGVLLQFRNQSLIEKFSRKKVFLLKIQMFYLINGTSPT